MMCHLIFLKRIKGKAGNLLLTAIVAMAMIGLAAATLVTLNADENMSNVDDLYTKQALAVGNAGIQYALEQLDIGKDPTVTGKSFDKGSFDIKTDPRSSLVTVTSTVGPAKKTQSINTKFGTNSVDLYVNQAKVSSNVLQGIQLYKRSDSNTQAVLSKVTMTWNQSSCATNVQCDGSVNVSTTAQTQTVVYENVGNPPSGKFWICHVPPGNPSNRQTLSVNIMGWINGHSAGTGGSHNQDYLGPCIAKTSSTTTPTTAQVSTQTTCDGTNISQTTLASCQQDDGGNTVTKMVLGTTTIFNAGSIPATSSVATQSGIATDIADTVMKTNGAYTLDVTFSKNITVGTWFTVQTEYADGSTSIGLIKAGNQSAPPPAYTDTTSTNPTTLTPPVATGFTVQNGAVTVNPNYSVKFDVIGSAITCGAGGASIPVYTELCVNGTCSKLFNYADVNGGETFTSVNGNQISSYMVRAKAASPSCGNYSATYDSSNTVQVKTLKNGDQAPALAGFGGQKSVQQFLGPYLDSTGKAKLAVNQVIMLFELGTDASITNNSAADFQDLVVVLTVSNQ